MPAALFALAVLLLALLGTPALHAESGLPVPRFVSLGADRIHLRKGPGTQYPIEWVYLREGLPVEVTAEYDVWRRIRDMDNTIGWVRGNLLSGRRTAMVRGETRALYRRPGARGGVVALVEPGVIGRLEACEDAWCELRVGAHSGWLRRDFLWGVYPDEDFD